MFVQKPRDCDVSAITPRGVSDCWTSCPQLILRFCACNILTALAFKITQIA